MADKLGCFVATIDLKLAPKLRSDLEERGFIFSKPPHTIFSAKSKGISCTLYLSGKLTVQGKGMGEFIEFYLEPEILGALSYTHQQVLAIENSDTRERIGVDEAGKGDFFGPLCIAALKADENEIRQLIEIGVKDSKKMNDTAMLKMSIILKERFAHSIILISPKRYNEMYRSFQNLNRLLAWGHATAIETLYAKTGCKRALIDQFGGAYLVQEAIDKKNLQIDLEQRTHAEADPVVAAASILARIGFVQGLEKLGQEVGMTLPKGASSQVIHTGRILVREKGKEILETVAKMHFKTYQEIVQDGGR